MECFHLRSLSYGGQVVANAPRNDGSTAITPAVLLGRQLEWLVSGLGLATIIIAGFTTRKKRRGTL